MLRELLLYEFLIKRFKTVLLGRCKTASGYAAKNDVNTFLAALGGV